MLGLLLWVAAAAPGAVPAQDDAVAAARPVAALQVPLTNIQLTAVGLIGVRDDAAMMIVGAALIGLAAAVRRV